MSLIYALGESRAFLEDFLGGGGGLRDTTKIMWTFNNLMMPGLYDGDYLDAVWREECSCCTGVLLHSSRQKEDEFACESESFLCDYLPTLRNEWKTRRWEYGGFGKNTTGILFDFAVVVAILFPDLLEPAEKWGRATVAGMWPFRMAVVNGSSALEDEHAVNESERSGAGGPRPKNLVLLPTGLHRNAQRVRQIFRQGVKTIRVAVRSARTSCSVPRDEDPGLLPTGANDQQQKSCQRSPEDVHWKNSCKTSTNGGSDDDHPPQKLMMDTAPSMWSSPLSVLLRRAFSDPREAPNLLVYCLWRPFTPLIAKLLRTSGLRKEGLCVARGGSSRLGTEGLSTDRSTTARCTHSCKMSVWWFGRVGTSVGFEGTGRASFGRVGTTWSGLRTLLCASVQQRGPYPAEQRGRRRTLLCGSTCSLFGDCVSACGCGGSSHYAVLFFWHGEKSYREEHMRYDVVRAGSYRSSTKVARNCVVSGRSCSWRERAKAGFFCLKKYSYHVYVLSKEDFTRTRPRRCKDRSKGLRGRICLA